MGFIIFLLIGCFQQNNEGYLEVINFSSDSIEIWGFGKGEEIIAIEDTSKLYTFDLGEYEHIWYCVHVSGKYISDKGPRFPNSSYDYFENVCINNGMKTILEISDYLADCSVTITNKTPNNITYLSAERAELFSFLDPEESERWDFRAPIDSFTYFSIMVQEPFQFDTLVAISGGEHLNVEILSQ